MGAIMLSPGLDKCLLVKSWGANGAWGFPRGKIAPNETDAECAVREVGPGCKPYMNKLQFGVSDDMGSEHHALCGAMYATVSPAGSRICAPCRLLVIQSIGAACAHSVGSLHSAMPGLPVAQDKSITTL